MLPHDNDLDTATAPAPCANALTVGTFALMTRWAATPEHTCAGPGPNATPLRTLLARKIVSNLFFLMNHPAVPVPMARALANAHAEWVGLASAVDSPPSPAGRFVPIAAAQPASPEPRPADVTLH